MIGDRYNLANGQVLVRTEKPENPQGVKFPLRPLDVDGLHLVQDAFQSGPHTYLRIVEWKSGQVLWYRIEDKIRPRRTSGHK